MDVPQSASTLQALLQPAMAVCVQAPLVASQASVVQLLKSLQSFATPPVHAPATHASALVHGLLSLHTTLFSALFVQAPVVALHWSVVHGLLSLHVLVVPPVQLPPALQVSPVRQALPLLHVVPWANGALPHWLVARLQVAARQVFDGVGQSLFFKQNPPQPLSAVFTQAPVVASQLSAVQALLSLQFLAVPAQVPAVQVSALVHGSASLHGAPVCAVPVHLPAAQWSCVVHALLSLQLFTLFAVPAQTPAVHVSWLVQTLLSLQLPPVAAVCVHAPEVASQLSVVQGLLSLHCGAVPAQTPAVHTSLVVHALPSLHGTLPPPPPPPPPPTLVCWQLPVPGWQKSLVQLLPSSQLLATPPVQVPI